MIRRATWERVKADGIAKWDEGRKQTEETYSAWMDKKGMKPCSFCSKFECYNCPLNDGNCSDEYDNCCSAWEDKDFPTFIANAALLFKRIESLTYEEVKNATS